MKPSEHVGNISSPLTLLSQSKDGDLFKYHHLVSITKI